jgi:CMP-N,N'-diacetyllegionaminic acid synthase
MKRKLVGNVLWLIVARSQSKSIRHKNVKLLNGMPLFGYRVKTALSISVPSSVWCSTDSKRYAKMAREFGASTPFLRPKYLASDSTSSIDVVLHAMNFSERNENNFEFIALLEPTSPFVYKKDILTALEVLKGNKEATAIVSVRESRPNTIFIQNEADYLDVMAERLKNEGNLRRQKFPKQITPSGGFYISRWESLKMLKTFYSETTVPYLIPDETSLEIDEPVDWRWAEFLIEKKIVDLRKIY